MTNILFFESKEKKEYVKPSMTSRELESACVIAASGYSQGRSGSPSYDFDINR